MTTKAMNCPICAQALDGGELVMVCHPCHKALGGALSVSATGEFRVPVAAELFLGSEGEADLKPVKPDLAAPPPAAVCAWCSKRENEVRKLLGRGNVALCDECVSLASDIMEAELGANWR